MALHQQRDRPPPFRGELEPAGGGGGGALRLADHRTQAAVAQPFLHQRKQLSIIRCLGIEYAVRFQPDLIEAGREQVAPPHHPQYRSPGARGDTREEQCRRGIVAGIGARRGDLMQRIQPQPAIGEPRIDGTDSERQHLTAAMAIPLNRPQRRAQIGDDAAIGAWYRRSDRHGHDSAAVSFAFCSHRASRVKLDSSFPGLEIKFQRPERPRHAFPKGTGFGERFGE